MNIIDWLFPPNVIEYDQMIVTAPDSSLLRNISETLGPHPHVQLHASYHVKVAGKRIHIGNQQMAFVLLKRRWWTRKPAVTIAIVNR